MQISACSGYSCVVEGTEVNALMLPSQVAGPAVASPSENASLTARLAGENWANALTAKLAPTPIPLRRPITSVQIEAAIGAARASQAELNLAIAERLDFLNRLGRLMDGLRARNIAPDALLSTSWAMDASVVQQLHDALGSPEQSFFAAALGELQMRASDMSMRVAPERRHPLFAKPYTQALQRQKEYTEFIEHAMRLYGTTLAEESAVLQQQLAEAKQRAAAATRQAEEAQAALGRESAAMRALAAEADLSQQSSEAARLAAETARSAALSEAAEAHRLAQQARAEADAMVKVAQEEAMAASRHLSTVQAGLSKQRQTTRDVAVAAAALVAAVVMFR